MDPSAITDRTNTAVYLAIALIFLGTALSLAWLQVERVINPAASQIVRLGTGAVILIIALRVLEVFVGRSN